MRLLALALLLTGCAFAFEPPGAKAIAPYPEYLALWDSAQACTGLHGDFNQLRFFVVPGHSFYDDEDQEDAGLTEGHTIYFAEDFVHHHMVIKHEMIHALGVHGHPATPFETPCRSTWSSYHGEY